MKTLINLTELVVISCILCACSGKRIDLTTLTYGTSDKEEVTDLFGTGASRKFHFRVHEKNYSFLKYHVPDSSDTLGFLFEGNKLVGVKKADSWLDAFGYDRCIVYPLSYDDNIHECFLNTTNDFIATRHPLETLTFAPDDIGALETLRYTIEFATYATVAVVLVPPVAVLAGAFMPIALVSEWQYAETQDELIAEFQLGEPIGKYEKLLNEYPGRTISKSQISSSILIPAGFVFKKPAYSIGIHDGEIIWLDEKPLWMCSSGFSIEECKLGQYNWSTVPNTPSQLPQQKDSENLSIEPDKPGQLPQPEDGGNFWMVDFSHERSGLILCQKIL